MDQDSPLGTSLTHGESLRHPEAHSSGVSWAAVIAGTFVTAALSLSLLALGAGFGLLSLSPWSSPRARASAVGIEAIIWLVVIQVVSSGLGGYLAGRLRTKWAAVHTDEVYFRDTAHGFLVWAVAVVISASLLGSAATALVGASAESAQAGGQENTYFADLLFRTSPASAGTAPNADTRATREEAAGIFANALAHGALTKSDQDFLEQLVSARTGFNPRDAQERVSTVLQQIQQTADAARKTTARFLLWTFLALLIGAFCASYAATVGGRQRDRVTAH